ncbi:MAG: hypothetical protein Q4A04_06595 [Eubacteriales bacterium]|nr:hypothetical protein [Eubacteriales bacterium]
MKRRIAGMLAFLMLLVSAVPSFAAGTTTYSECWKTTAAGTWYVADAKGNQVKNTWLCDDAVPANGKEVWYVLGPDGTMVTGGLIRDKTGNYYSLETARGGYYGMMRNKSGVYDGIELTIQTAHLGNFGAILNADGIAALKAKYGVTQVDIDNSNIVYSSKIASKKVVSYSAGSSEEKKEDDDKTEHVLASPFTDGTKKLGHAILSVADGGKTITYKNSSNTPQKLTITTKADETLIIDAPLDDIFHEGEATEVKVLAAADNSYVCSADVESLSVESGHVVLNGAVDEMTVESTGAVSIDVSVDASVGGTVEVSKKNKNEEVIAFHVEGLMDTIESSTGDLSLTVGIDAVSPKLMFVGEETVKAYKKRCEERLGKETIIASVKCGDEVMTHKTLGEDTRSWMIMGETFEDDVYVNGDFTRIIFAGCTFKGDIINRGCEMCMAMFAGCNFATPSECRFENNGRQLLSVNDLISKFVWVESVNEDVDVICDDDANGAVIAISTLSPVLFNGNEYSFENMEYYCDESAGGSGELEKYTGQPVNLLYVGKMNLVDGTDPLIILGEYDKDSGPAIYPSENPPQEE